MMPGIAPPPREPLAGDWLTWKLWARWFSLLTDAVPYVRTYSVAVTPTAVGANTTSEQTVTVTGLSTSDVVVVNKPSHTAGCVLTGARVSATGTLALTFANLTAGSITPPAETYTVAAVRR